jgi:diadenosine tetraphosphatase ApaH/serine/threonine PP2A family protein phosphatase
MRYLVLTDIHANLEALETVLADASAHGYDQTLVLGDLVGYGPNPNEVVERIKSLNPVAMIRGNHDKVACGLEQPEGFNAVARRAAIWTFEVLTAENRTWLAALPKGPIIVDDLIQICHGSPVDEDAYLFDELDAVRALKKSQRPLCLFGHTHYPITFALIEDRVSTIGGGSSPDGPLVLQEGAKYLMNPGAVGQPRDGDPRAAYTIVDTATQHVDEYRLPYDIPTTQAKIIAAGLPEVLAQRLAVGR